MGGAGSSWTHASPSGRGSKLKCLRNCRAYVDSDKVAEVARSCMPYRISRSVELYSVLIYSDPGEVTDLLE